MDFLKTHIDFIILGTLGLMSFIMLWKVVERYLFFARLDVRRYPNIHELNIALERNLTPIYTIGSNAPYVGLLGTVTGILITFYDMGQHGGNIDAAQIMIGLALAQALADQPKALDKQGDWFYELLSAFHKSLRGSSPDGAMYWFARMVDGGADPLIIARRMLCVASEDIGNADPNALNLALNAYQTYERLGAPEGYLALAQTITYLALAPKSNASYKAMKAAFAYVRANPAHPVPLHLRNAPTAVHKNEGYGAGYRYAHDEPQAYAAGQTYLPAEMAGIRFYHPNRRGFEIKLADKLEQLQALDEQTNTPLNPHRSPS